MVIDRTERREPVYNIIPTHDVLADHMALRYPEVRAAVAALQTLGDLRRPPGGFQQRQGMDLLDWLQAFFGFQEGNVKNQREHLILLLSNSQMRLTPAPDPIDKLDASVLRKLRKKVLKNYTLWCSFLGRKSNVRLHGTMDERLELLYISLYFLIWGEAANLRFMPECLAYIFHHMAAELNGIIGDYIDEHSAQPVLPASYGENGFLMNVVTPLYSIVKAEAEASADGRASHSSWRNYDDMNEFFWSNRCFWQLKWPLDKGSNYLVEPKKSRSILSQKVGKTGFVERRSFWNLFRSFDRLWVMYILVFQASMLVAWQEAGAPWDVLQKKDNWVRLLSIFITWAGLRVLQAFLDAWMQRQLVSRQTLLVGIRMLLKIVSAVVWTLVFVTLYVKMWVKRRDNGFWSDAANQRLRTFLQAAVVFVAPEVLALLLFVLPWIRNFIEKRDWKIFSILTWWFQTRLFVGRGLRESLIDNIKYTAFWVLLLAAKFSFSYEFQIKALVAPTKATLRARNIDYKWHEFFGSGNRVAVVVLWAPVLLVYFMDTQIWYSVFSSVVGSLVGLFSHIGEIRNLHHFRLRFPFFASAIQFNLMPEDALLRPRLWGSWSTAVKDVLHRLKLRYGFGAYKRIESKQIEERRFVYVWNRIIRTFREEDLINDREIDLLEIPVSSWNISVLQWPTFLLSNEILVSLGQAREWQGTDRGLWRKISKNEYRPCAIIECYESLKHILLHRIVDEQKEEMSILKSLFEDIDGTLQLGKFCQTFNVSQLPNIHAKVLDLVKVLCSKPTPDNAQKVVYALQNLYEVAVRDFPRHSGLQKYLRPKDDALLFVDAVSLPDPEDESFYHQLKRVQTILSTKEAIARVPHNLEARRRIAFFSNSLFMTMPRAPQVEKMLAFSVLTPYYSETVLFTKKELLEENEDGVSILFYLQKIYPDEWNNFLERMLQRGIKESDLWATDDGLELRLWASYRGQTLARTVRGMMYYNRALQMLAFLDSASENDLQGYRELLSFASSMGGSMDGTSLDSGSLTASTQPADREKQFSAAASLKFTYVVACQIYGSQKAKNEARAQDILYLMKEHHEALRIAYVDEVVVEGNSKCFYSVLVKYDPELQREVEIYRVQLPGPVKLGEGKPENQNHALIFTRGEAVQTIDMNQDNYFEEAMKMRNLLQEFTQYYGMRKPSILGVREHVFTGSVSSLAWFMSAQETSFVTLGQRVLANPLKVRMHYGHPDVFDRLWFISRGGISKASRVINISEDIYAGFNCTLRGGNVTHHEYIQVGKGRDVGLNQIALFEAKVASGNGEQVLSRDVYRLGHRLDFFRMLSFYYSTVGFYVNNMLVVLTVYAFLWGRVYLALSGVEAALLSDSVSNKALTAALNQQFLVQIGLFTALPMIVENALERGFGTAIWDFFTMQLQLASMFFTFSMGTKTHYFGRTLLHGGAKYRATGRGFVVRHERFAENYRLFARSHFTKGLELVLLLVVYEAYGALSKSTTVYILLTFSSWFLAITWILGPFVFNPSGFDWLKTVEDFDDFMNWIFYRGGVLVKGEQSWESWWDEEQDHLRTSSFWGKLFEVVLSLRFFFFQYGIVYQLGIANHSTSILVYLLSWIFVVVAFLLHKILSFAQEKYATREHLYYRGIQSLAFFFTILVIVLLVQFTNFRFLDLVVSLLAFVPTGWGLLQIAQVLRRPYLEKTGIWPTVITVARLYELGLGILVMLPTAVLSWLPGFQAMQTRILFNQAFSRGLQISRILASRKPKSYTGY